MGIDRADDWALSSARRSRRSGPPKYACRGEASGPARCRLEVIQGRRRLRSRRPVRPARRCSTESWPRVSQAAAELQPERASPKRLRMIGVRCAQYVCVPFVAPPWGGSCYTPYFRRRSRFGRQQTGTFSPSQFFEALPTTARRETPTRWEIIQASQPKRDSALVGRHVQREPPYDRARCGLSTLSPAALRSPQFMGRENMMTSGRGSHSSTPPKPSTPEARDHVPAQRITGDGPPSDPHRVRVATPSGRTPAAESHTYEAPAPASSANLNEPHHVRGSSRTHHDHHVATGASFFHRAPADLASHVADVVGRRILQVWGTAGGAAPPSHGLVTDRWSGRATPRDGSRTTTWSTSCGPVDHLDVLGKPQPRCPRPPRGRRGRSAGCRE